MKAAIVYRGNIRVILGIYWGVQYWLPQHRRGAHNVATASVPPRQHGPVIQPLLLRGFRDVWFQGCRPWTAGTIGTQDKSIVHTLHD